MSQHYKMPRKYLRGRKQPKHCEECNKKTNELYQRIDGNNCSITYYSPYLCKSCYNKKYKKEFLNAR